MVVGCQLSGVSTDVLEGKVRLGILASDVRIHFSAVMIQVPRFFVVMQLSAFLIASLIVTAVR